MAKFITDTKTLTAKIASIGKRGKKLDTDIHLAAVSCLYHTREHGDWTLFQKLCLAMPKSGRVKALCTWAEAFAPMTIDRKKFTVTLQDGRTPEMFKLDAADETPFWEFTQETEARDFTLEMLLRKLDNIATGGTEKQPSTPEAKAAALKAIKAIKGNSLKAAA